MFKKIIKALFSSENNGQKANYFAFEEMRDKRTKQLNTELVSPEPELKLASYTPVSVEEKIHYEFFNYLFGTSTSGNTNDELTDYVATKVSKLLEHPESLFNALPPLPESMTELVEQLKNKDFDTELLVSSIQKEPLVVAKVIELANSNHYRRSGKDVIDLKKAFLLLGVDGLVEGVINAFVNQMTPLKRSYFKMYGVRIWQHSESSGRIAKTLAEDSSLSDSAAIAYFGALLSDLGDMVIYQLLTDAFSYVHPDCQPDTLAFRKLMGFNSSGLTYYIASYWQLPLLLTECLETQLSITDKSSLRIVAEHSPIGSLIYEARLLAMLELMVQENALDNELLTVSKSMFLSPAANNYFDALVVKCEALNNEKGA